MAAIKPFISLLIAYFCTVYLPEVKSSTTKKSKIIIVGTGMSGIGFAEALYKQNNKDFIIIEARDKVGGRMREATFAGITISAGAGWIHEAEDDNPIWLLKKKYGLKTTPDNYSNFIVRNENNQKISGGDTLWKRIQAIFKKVSPFITEEEKKKRPDIPLKTAMQILGWNPKNSLEDTIDFFLTDFENANSYKVLSSRAATATGQYPDAIVTDSRGYSYIPKKLSEPFKSKIHFNTTVRSIKYNKTTVVVSAVRNGVNVTYIGSYAVLTVSSGVLASSYITFQPKLPTWKMEAVYRVPMGYYSKIFLKFPSKFWGDSYYILAATKFRGYLCHWQNLDRAELYPGSRMLLLTVVGDDSIRIEKLTDDEIKQEALKELKKMYGNSVPAPTDLFLHRWSQDPLAQGAYSSPVVGYTDETYQALRAPIDTSLWFTGEATDLELFGYTHGAYQIGTAQAKRFLTCTGGGECPKVKVTVKKGNNGEKIAPHLVPTLASVLCQLMLLLQNLL